MRRSEDFQRAVRRGTRASSATLLVYAVASDDAHPARVGFIVSRAVGNAVVRNRVKRRLRHAVGPRLSRFGAALVVVRAQPAAAVCDFSGLVGDLEGCLARLECASR